jgi:type II secretory pathway component PulF
MMNPFAGCFDLLTESMYTVLKQVPYCLKKVCPMSSLKHRIQFYHTLATMEEAGVPRIRALGQAFPGTFRPVAARLAVALTDGFTLSAAMRTETRHFSPFECNLIAVGEQTGRLDLVLQSLADWFQLVKTLRDRMISGLIYPVLVYHVAGVLIPLISMFTDNISLPAAATQAFVWMAAPWLLYFMAAVIGPLLFSGGLLDAVLLQVPLAGALSYKLNSTRFFFALSLCLRAGITITDAIPLAAGGCTNAYLAKRFHRIVDTMKSAGCTFTEAFENCLISRDRGSMILELMRTGEQSGHIDEAAERIAKTCREEAETLLARVAVVLPTLVYLAIATYVGYKIISFYSKLLAPLRDL